MLLESFHNAAYTQKDRFISQYISLLLNVGYFDHKNISPIAHSDDILSSRIEKSVRSRELSGSRICHIQGEVENNLEFGNAPEQFIPASIAKPIILAGVINRGNTMDWIDEKLAFSLIVDSDNQVFEDVMKKALDTTETSFLPMETDKLLQEMGVSLSRDQHNTRFAEIKSLARAYQGGLKNLPLSIHNALVVPINPQDTSDTTGKAIAKLQSRLKNTSPLLFKIGLDKNIEGDTVTSYFMQIGQELIVGYCVGGSLAATKHIVDVASHLIQINKFKNKNY